MSRLPAVKGDSQSDRDACEAERGGRSGDCVVNVLHGKPSAEKLPHPVAQVGQGDNPENKEGQRDKIVDWGHSCDSTRDHASCSSLSQGEFFLLALAERTTTQSVRCSLLRGARTLFQEVSPGRPPIDDTAALSAITSMMQSGTPKAIAIDTVGRRLGMSTRTLSRKLAAEGTTFRRVLDEARCQLATALLHDRGLSVADIAFFLQYSEAAAFHRSFRRWTGLTPRGFREGVH